MATITNGNVSKESFGKSSLDYVPGLVAKSMIEAADYYNSFDWSKPWFLSVKEYGDKYYNSVANKGGSLDDLNAVKLYFGLYNNTEASSSDKEHYKTAISRAQAGLVAHNENCSIKAGTLAGDDVVGGWFHKTDYNNQMWLDGAYMGSALLAQIVNFNGTGSNIFGSTTADWDMVFKQMNIVWNMCWNSTDKLMYHAFEANAGKSTSNSHAETWAGLNGTTQPYTFHSQAYWGRANAWYLMALVDVLEAMDKAGQSTTENYKTLKQHLADLAAGIAARQDAATGGWYQLLDKDGSYTATSYNSKWSGKPSSETNYIETSATAIFSAAYFKAVRLGLLTSTTYDYKNIAKNAFEGIVNKYTYLDADGNLEIFGSSRSAGLGGNGNDYIEGGKKFRDGSNAYYLLGYDVQPVKQNDGITEGKVLGGFIMAATEYERAYQNQDSKQILFAKDLAPEYDFSTTAGSLDATAYGSGDVTYKWYKNGVAVENATSATYTPTESGNYYCKATSGSTTIQTSTASVTVNASTGGEDKPTTSDEGTITFSSDDLKDFESPMTDATKTVTIATTTGTISSESAGDIKVSKKAAFSITVPEGKYIKSITYTIKANDKGALTFAPDDNNKVVSKDELTYTYNYTDNTLKSVTATNSADKGGIQVTSIKITYGTVGSTPSTEKYKVTAAINLTEAGKVTIWNGETEVTSGSEVPAGTTLTFKANKNSLGQTGGLWSTQNWTVNGTVQENNTSDELSIVISQNTNVVFNVKKVYSIYNTPKEGGTSTITWNGQAIENGGEVDSGATIICTATPSSGYKFTKWVNGANEAEVLGTGNPLTINNISKDTNVRAEFEKESTGGETTTTNIFSATVNSDATLTATSGQSIDLTSQYISIEGGKATLHNGKGSSADMITKTDGIKLNGSSASYLKITLDKPLAEGDIINADVSSDLYITADATKNTDFGITKDDSSISIPKGSSLIGKTEIYLWAGKFKSIKITRQTEQPATPVTLSATFAQASVEATEGEASVAAPTLTVTAGETTLSAEAYDVTYASNATDIVNVTNKTLVPVKAGQATITANITPEDTERYNGTTATFTVNVKEKATEPTKDEVIYLWNTIGKTRYGAEVKEGEKAIGDTSTPCINFGSNYSSSLGKYMAIAPANGGFKAGDIVTISGLYTGSKSGIGIEVHTTVNGKNPYKTPYFTKDVTTTTFTVTEDCDSLYLGRYGGATPNVTALKVVRPASSASKTKLTALFERTSDVVINNEGTITLPKLTVKAGDNVMTEGNDYKVEYKSNDESVATISGQNINIVGKEGLATIAATITPINTADYEGCTANYQITVKAPIPLNISVQDVTINTTDADVKQPEIKVYGDNDNLLKLGTDYTLSFTVGGDKNVEVNNGKFSVLGSAYAWTKGTSTITVTATPTENLGNTFTAGTLNFTYDVAEGKIKPKFLSAFDGITVKLHKDKNNREFTIPLIYDGEDVSSYFNYTYIVTGTANPKVSGNKLTYQPSTEGTFTVTVNAIPGKNGDDDYSDVYDTPDAISFTLDVRSNYAVPIINLDPESISMYTGTTEGAPDVTVTKKDGNTDVILDESEYTTTWTSFAPGIIKVDVNSGKLEAIREGTAQVRIVVRGTEDSNIESTTKFFTVYVDDPALYRVKSDKNVKYGNHTTMWNQDKTLSVTLGGWMFPNDGTPDTKILDPNKEQLSNKYSWDTTSAKAKWKLTGFDYYVPGNSSKNARQENGSNAMPETTTIGSADFKTYTTNVVDPMFNVPCSGSFLVFNPKTNGKVTTHIFQNGVFDSGVYRPQRRVFIMDEAGNFVSSNARIESTNGKPTGGVYDLSQYKWDLNGGNAPTAADVANHFDGLENFEMSKDGFKNNVYPSALSTDIMPNEAIGKHPKDKSAHGWCVLADSPVTYSFSVKAGKTYYLYNFGSKIGFYGFSFEEDANKPIVDTKTFNDNEENKIESTPEGHVAQVTVNRNMPKDRWTTCVLPFSLNREQVDCIFGKTYDKDNVAGTQILYFDHVANGKAYFVRHAYNTIVANKPFLIKPTKDVESINTADCANYPYVTIEATESGEPDDWCKSNGYVWKSSYNVMDIVKDDYFIGSSDGKFKAYAGDKGTVKGFRGFLKADLNSEAKPQKLMISTYSNTGNNNGETTGIEGLIIDSDGQIKNYPTNGRVYNTNGQLVSEDASNFQSLPRGIYIINGKKYVK